MYRFSESRRLASAIQSAGGMKLSSDEWFLQARLGLTARSPMRASPVS
jgi:hypothetical protein